MGVHDDAIFMRLALREAVKGQWKTSPNPCVGAVVVQDGSVVGKGYHQRAGAPHAEVNALVDAGEKAVGGTIYVTLEPCNHTGRTPPCTEAILRAGITRVVIGMDDPNPRVEGGGGEFLAGKGLSVTRRVLSEDCEALNRPFIKHITTGMPWVILKAGLSLDGRLAVASGQSAWITNEKARAVVHRLRHQVDAILIGSGTAITDNPSLTARLSGQRRGRDPLRVVLDSGLRLPLTATLVQQQSLAETWIFCDHKVASVRVAQFRQAGVTVKKVSSTVDGQLDLQAILKELGQADITSVLVEGGGTVHTSFLAQHCADEAYFFVAPVLLGGDGVPMLGATGFSQVEQGYRMDQVSFRRLGDNMMIRGRLRP